MNKRPLNEGISDLISMFMALFYVGGGVALISSSTYFTAIRAGWPRIALAVLLVAYGVYRGYRGWSNWRKSKNEER